MNRVLIAAATAVTALVLGAGSALAQSYPSKPVRIINPFPPGAANDVIARALAAKLSERWKQAVIVDNKTGASGNIGMEYVARAPADGYTFVIGANTMAMVPWLFPKLGFDMLKDFAPVLYVGDVGGVVVVRPDFPAASLRELIEYARAHPGKVSYASSGSGSPQHIVAEYFNALAKVETLHVPYKGAAQSWVALMSGEVDMTFGAVSSAAPLIQAGKLKALAVGSKTRSDSLPGVPSSVEAGLPGLEFGFWYGIFAPAHTPQPIIDRFYQDASEILAGAELKANLAQQHFDIVNGSPRQLGELLERDYRRWGKVINDAGIRTQ
ncbi:MAG: Bug family tripartite tricarboxylate transporter substrate binding protein [Lautropia sp.]